MLNICIYVFRAKHMKTIHMIYILQLGWGITGQKITGQSCPDWLKMTSKPNSGLSRL